VSASCIVDAIVH